MSMTHSHWAGLLITPHSLVTAIKPVKIDRAEVRVYRTLYGEIFYQVEGCETEKKAWWPVTGAMEDAGTALDACAEIKKEIDAARAADARRAAGWRLKRGITDT